MNLLATKAVMTKRLLVCFFFPTVVCTLKEITWLRACVVTPSLAGINRFCSFSVLQKICLATGNLRKETFVHRR